MTHRRRTWPLILAICLTGWASIAGAAPWPNLAVDPPRMLFWCNVYSSQPTAFLTQSLRDCDIFEIGSNDPNIQSTLASLAASNGISMTNKTFIRYGVTMTWDCPGNAPGVPCSSRSNTIYGDARWQYGEPVLNAALVHWSHGGSVTQKCNRTNVKVSWNAGDPVDMAHMNLSGPLYGPCGRPVGTHRLVNPQHPDTIVLVNRYIDTMGAAGVTGVRIDEFLNYWSGVNDGDFQEYPTKTAYLSAWANRLASMRTRSPWKYTCPSVGDFSSDTFRAVAASGGCVSTEDFPSGRTLIPNNRKLTVAQARAAYSPYFLWADHLGQPNTDVPNNIRLGTTYEGTGRNVIGAAGAINIGQEFNQPNLVFLFYCSTLVGIGPDLQREFGRAGDRIYCNDANQLRNPSTGLLPPWYN